MPRYLVECDQDIEQELRKIEGARVRNEDDKFARVAWTAEDILTLRPAWTEERATEWLEQNEKYVQDRSVELGWEVIETLLDD